jgi:hypothetical protein
MRQVYCFIGPFVVTFGLLWRLQHTILTADFIEKHSSVSDDLLSFV